MSLRVTLLATLAASLLTGSSATLAEDFYFRMADGIAFSGGEGEEPEEPGSGTAREVRFSSISSERQSSSTTGDVRFVEDRNAPVMVSWVPTVDRNGDLPVDPAAYVVTNDGRTSTITLEGCRSELNLRETPEDYVWTYEIATAAVEEGAWCPTPGSVRMRAIDEDGNVDFWQASASMKPNPGNDFDVGIDVPDPYPHSPWDSNRPHPPMDPSNPLADVKAIFGSSYPNAAEFTGTRATIPVRLSGYDGSTIMVFRELEGSGTFDCGFTGMSCRYETAGTAATLDIREPGGFVSRLSYRIVKESDANYRVDVTRTGRLNVFRTNVVSLHARDSAGGQAMNDGDFRFFFLPEGGVEFDPGAGAGSSGPASPDGDGNTTIPAGDGSFLKSKVSGFTLTVYGRHVYKHLNNRFGRFSGFDNVNPMTPCQGDASPLRFEFAGGCDGSDVTPILDQDGFYYIDTSVRFRTPEIARRDDRPSQCNEWLPVEFEDRALYEHDLMLMITNWQYGWHKTIPLGRIEYLMRIDHGCYGTDWNSSGRFPYDEFLGRPMSGDEIGF